MFGCYKNSVTNRTTVDTGAAKTCIQVKMFGDYKSSVTNIGPYFVTTGATATCIKVKMFGDYKNAVTNLFLANTFADIELK